VTTAPPGPKVVATRLVSFSPRNRATSGGARPAGQALPQTIANKQVMGKFDGNGLLRNGGDFWRLRCLARRAAALEAPAS
jgi:hypothetical protein